MNKNSNFLILEWLSLSLVLSFFLFHNIFLVISGIVLSICIIKMDIIYSTIDYILNIINKIHKVNPSESTFSTLNLKIMPNNQEDKPSLVEKIEELGFIPTSENENDSNAA